MAVEKEEESEGDGDSYPSQNKATPHTQSMPDESKYPKPIPPQYDAPETNPPPHGKRPTNTKTQQNPHLPEPVIKGVSNASEII